MGTETELLTTSQVARLLEMSESQVRRLADRGILPVALKVGRQRFFAVGDVREFLARREDASR